MHKIPDPLSPNRSCWGEATIWWMLTTMFNETVIVTDYFSPRTGTCHTSTGKMTNTALIAADNLNGWVVTFATVQIDLTRSLADVSEWDHPSIRGWCTRLPRCLVVINAPNGGVTS